MWFAYLFNRFNKTIASLHSEQEEASATGRASHVPMHARQEAGPREPPSKASKHASEIDQQAQRPADNLDQTAASASTLGLSSFFDK